jgi:hypothetical protein
MIALRVSFCRGNTDAPSQRLHTPYAPRREVPRTHLPPRRGAGRARSGLLGTAQQRGHVYHLRRRAAGSRGDTLPRVANSPSVDRALAQGGNGRWRRNIRVGRLLELYRVEERAPYLGETRAWVGDAT